MKQTKHYNGFSWRFQDVCILRRIWVVCVKAHSTKTNFEGFQNKNKFSWRSFESFRILLKFVNASLKFFFQISFPKREEHLSRLSKTSISGQKTTFISLSKTMVSRPKKALISRENPSCNYNDLCLAISGCVHPTQNLSSMRQSAFNQNQLWRFSEQKQVLLKKFWKLSNPLEICERFTKIFLSNFISKERRTLISAIKNQHFRAENHFYFPFKNHGF